MFARPAPMGLRADTTNRRTTNVWRNLLISTAALATLTAGTSADLMNLTGMESTSKIALSAELGIEILSPESLKLTLLNTTSTAGEKARLTYFGIQLPTSGLVISLDPSSASNWSISNNSKLPGGGADTFNWLLTNTEKGAGGLMFEESLSFLVTAEKPLFESLDLTSWTLTSKNGLLAEAKFQSVGPNANLSGEVFSADAKLIPSTPSNSPVVPEPASLALVVAGLAFMLPRRRRNTENTTSANALPQSNSTSAPVQESRM
jgi:hypothetical protein